MQSVLIILLSVVLVILRGFDFYKYYTALKEYKAHHEHYEIINVGRNHLLLSFGAGLMALFCFIFLRNASDGISLGILFVALFISELMVTFTDYHLPFSNQDFLCGSQVIRFKSIRTISEVKRFKRLTVTLYNKETLRVVNGYAGELKKRMKSK